jgi:GDP-4-dehydro-6-deoxy-D-mannose reductase
MMHKLYMTGAGGFVGRCVAQAVAEGVFGDCELHSMPVGTDIRDADAVRVSLAAVKPDWVLHLAARSFVPDSFADPRLTLDVNLLGTLNLLSALKESAFKGRLLYVSSGDVYGAVPEEELPVTERRLASPRNPYAVSKLSGELLCQQWHYSEGLDVMVARPFNHIGPTQESRFVVPGFARQVGRIAAGQQVPELVVGDIDVSRDFCDVRDVIRAYAAMFHGGRPGSIYNVSSGREVKIRWILNELCLMAGVDPEIRQDASRLRPNEQRRMLASHDRLRADTGWEPTIPLETSLEQILQHFRTNETP